MLEGDEQYLKPGLSLAELEQQAMAMSDNRVRTPNERRQVATAGAMQDAVSATATAISVTELATAP